MSEFAGRVAMTVLYYYTLRDFLMVRSLELYFNVFYRLFGLQLLNIGQPLEMPFIVLALERYIHQLSTSIADHYTRRV